MSCLVVLCFMFDLGLGSSSVKLRIGVSLVVMFVVLMLLIVVIVMVVWFVMWFNVMSVCELVMVVVKCGDFVWIIFD